MKTSSALLLATSLPLLALACGSSLTSPQSVMCFSANVVASPANDYAFSSTITLPPVTVKAMTNLTFDWSAVTKDFLGHSLNPVSDLNTIAAMLFQLPIAELQSKLNDDTLSQSDLYTSVPVSWPPPGSTTGGATSAKLYDFQLNGTPVTQQQYEMYFDPTMFPPSMYSYMAAAATGTELGKGFRMLQSFKLDPASTATTVVLTNDSTKLTYQANLHSLTITGVPGGTAALTLDWGQMVTDMKNNALGGLFKPGYITSAIVGHYTETPAQLESKFLDLDRIATAYYKADIAAGTTLDFTTLKDGNGNAFTGVDSTGTWLVGLICGNCRNPAPWYMTILKPCTP